MPSDFESEFALAAAPGLYAVFGLIATYAAPDGTTVSGLTVRVHRNEPHQVERPGSSGRVSGELQTGEVMVLQSALAKPVKGGRFTVEGVEVWTIALTPVLKNEQFSCTCTRTGVERAMERRSER